MRLVRMVQAASFATLMISAPSRGQDYEVGETARLIVGLPKDASDRVVRADGRLHWHGEEPFDKARKKAIEDALRELGCAKLRADMAVLRAKYRTMASSPRRSTI
jgi:hypothetical protein